MPARVLGRWRIRRRLFIIFNVGYYVVFTYLPTYFIKTLGFTKTMSFVSITVASLVALVLILPLAALSDRIGRRPMLIGGALGFAVLAYPLFLLLNSGSIAAAIAAHCGLAAIESVYISAAVVAGVELFATRVRYSGFSIGYNIAVAAFGGTTPYVVTWLTGNTGNNLAPAFYVVVAAVISLVTVLTLRENAGRALPAVAMDERAAARRQRTTGPDRVFPAAPPGCCQPPLLTSSGVKKLLVGAVSALGAVPVSMAVFGTGVAAADDYAGQTYADASSALSDNDLKGVIATRIGDAKPDDECIVTHSEQAPWLKGDDFAPVSDTVLLYLNCNATVASATTPGNSAASPEGRAAIKKAKEEEAKSDRCADQKQPKHGDRSPPRRHLDESGERDRSGRIWPYRRGHACPRSQSQPR